jgi:hypothetical protein
VNKLGLLKRQKKECYNKTKAAYGEARVLLVAEAQNKNDEKLQKEQAEKGVKEKKAAL